MSNSYACYLVREAADPPEFTVVIINMDENNATLVEASRLFDANYPGYRMQWKVCAIEPYSEYTVEVQSGRWGVGTEAFRNRALWLRKRNKGTDHPSGHLMFMETLYTVEGALGDSDGNPTVIGTMDDALEFARRCFPGLDQQGWTEKLKPINVWLIK